MSYEESPACKMLATHCLICGRPLVDATSVSIGLGPECRREYDGGISDATRIEANKYVYLASLAAQRGSVDGVMEYASLIEGLGLTNLASKVARRFKNAAKRVKIVVTEEDGFLRVETPFRRGDNKRFVAAWRNIRGRRFMKGANYIPVTEKMALWDLLRDFFGGKTMEGPKGIFIIPRPEPDPQMELAIS